jgi:hypothetical protein
MSKPIMRIHDLATNEVIDREMTDAELADHNARLEEFAQEKAEAEAKAQAKAALLAQLGITEEQAKLLLS